MGAHHSHSGSSTLAQDSHIQGLEPGGCAYIQVALLHEVSVGEEHRVEALVCLDTCGVLGHHVRAVLRSTGRSRGEMAGISTASQGAGEMAGIQLAAQGADKTPGTSAGRCQGTHQQAWLYREAELEYVAHKSKARKGMGLAA